MRRAMTMLTFAFALAAEPAAALEQCKPSQINGRVDLYLSASGVASVCFLRVRARRFSGLCFVDETPTRAAGDLLLRRSCFLEGQFDDGGGQIEGTMQPDGLGGAGLLVSPGFGVHFSLVRRP